MDALNAFILDNVILIAGIIIGGVIIYGVAVRINNYFKIMR